MKRPNKQITKVIIISVAVLISVVVTVSCLTGRFGIDGLLTTPTDTIRVSDHPKASVTISVE